MNVKNKVYTEYLTLRLTKEEYDLLSRHLCRKNNDKLSTKAREFMFSHLFKSDEEYEIVGKPRKGKPVTIKIYSKYKGYSSNGSVREKTFESREAAMAHVECFNITKKEKPLSL